MDLWLFINEVVQRTAELRVQLHVGKENHVLYECQKCSGFFTHIPQPTLAFHLKGPTAAGVLYHEFNHMEQWHENCKAWRECKVTENIGTEDLIFLWSDKKIELSPAQLKTYIQGSVNVELDCERRTAKLVRRLAREGKTTIDVREYIQKANSYVMFWHMVGKTGKWYTIGKRPYELPEVWTEFPTTFSLDYTKLPKKYERLYEELCL